MRQLGVGCLVALWAVVAAAGCDDPTKCGDALTRCAPSGGETFESDLPPGSSGAAGSAAVGGSKGTDDAAEAPQAGDFDAREISEADVIQVQGDRLYALSRVTGLAVIDVSDPSALKLLGRYRELPATPFEMYLKDDVALVMFTGWGQYAAQDDGTYSWVSTSKLLALDVKDPSKIAQLGSFDVPGSISDSRIVGDVLYVIGHEDGYCWSCEQNKPRTAIVSLRVADPRNVSKAAELFYDDANSSWGQRSVTVTAQRMYVAGPEYGQDMPTGSTIQVVDISDKDGALVEGASIEVQGQVNSRWQMDEYNGVLRVVSQTPQWWTPDGRTTMKPAVQTFKVESSQKLSALGHADIDLPVNDTLRSVRFDAERGYAITAEQKDPLFTLDLSDPAQPRVVGELKLPGFVYYMEPRGNRLLGLGFDQGNAAGSITVSLFDVTDLAKPKELSRVNFGADWGSLPEDQDRIHKVFRVLDDVGLILVPFSGWKNQTSTDSDCYVSSFVGGVQLIDFAGDKLTARGAAPGEDEIRRALLVHDALLSVSDTRVQAFDVHDRAAPKQSSQLLLSRNVSRAVQLDNGVVARFSYGTYKGQTNVDFVDGAHADDPNQSASQIELATLVDQSTNLCAAFVSIDQTFVRGSRLELLYSWYENSKTTGNTEARRGLVALDLSDATKPKRIANATWSLDSQWYPYSSYYAYGYYGDNNSAVRTSNGLAMLESRSEYKDNKSTQHTRLRVLDLRDTDNVQTKLVSLDDDTSYSGLLADGDDVMTSYVAGVSLDGHRGRFYVARFDLSNPAEPKPRLTVNVPGALVSFDSASQRALTTEQVRVDVPEGLTVEECFKRFATAEWSNGDISNPGSVVSSGSVSFAPRNDGTAGADASDDRPAPERGTCTGYKQRLNLVHIERSAERATLDDHIDLPDDQQMFSLSKGDGVVFASMGHGGYYYPGAAVSDVACFGPCGGGGSTQPTQLLVLGGFADGKLEQGHLTVEDSDTSGFYGFWGRPPVWAYGKRALLAGRSDVAIIDASAVSDPKLVKRLPLNGSVSYAEVHEDNALLSLGAQGVQWLDLR